MTQIRVATNLEKPGEPGKSLLLVKKPGKRHFFRAKQRLKPGKPGKWTFSQKNGKMGKLRKIPTFFASQ